MLTRRAFFRSARTAVVGGVAAGVVAAVGLPALPQRLIPFKFNTYQRHILSHSAWRKIYSRPTLLDLARQTGDIHMEKIVKLLNETNEVLEDLSWKEEPDDA